MNAYAARALLSRIYLYHDDNEKAFQMASNLIEEVEGNGMYRLYTRDEYVPAWDLKNTTFIQIKNVPKVFTTFGTYPPGCLIYQ